jgi:hypothetical protein
MSVFAFVLIAHPFNAQSPVPKEKDQGNSASVTQHATAGGVEILTDTQGVDFGPWLKNWHSVTERTWKPLIPAEVNPPKLEKGTVAIRFKVLPNGQLMSGSMVLEGRTGYVALDHAAWVALTDSHYTPRPRDFHGPYVELRTYFLYNTEIDWNVLSADSFRF